MYFNNYSIKHDTNNYFFSLFSYSYTFSILSSSKRLFKNITFLFKNKLNYLIFTLYIIIFINLISNLIVDTIDNSNSNYNMFYHIDNNSMFVIVSHCLNML